MSKYKVVLLGEGRVGKTSILLRYIKGEYNEQQVSTLQASYLDKKMVIPNNKNVHLSIWDTAGQERFHALGPIYYRDADGALLVYDITDSESFEKVRNWVRELRKIVGEDISIVIAGNKVDLKRNRKVSEEEANQYAKSVGAVHFLTSAKLDKGLEEAFQELTVRMINSKKNRVKKKALSHLMGGEDDDEEDNGDNDHEGKGNERRPPDFQSSTSTAISSGRKRGGGRKGQTIQIVDDDALPSNSGRRGEDRLRLGGGASASAGAGSTSGGKAKSSGCC